MKTVQIDGADVLLFREGRPFGEAEGANVARTLPLPFPGTLAGGLRSADTSQTRYRQQLRVHGPLVKHSENGVLFPAPVDLLRLVVEGKADWYPLERGSGGGCDLPGGLLPLEPTEDGKPDSDPFWEKGQFDKWLLGEKPEASYRGRRGPEIEERMHVGIDSALNKADDGKLFGVRYLDFGMKWSLLVQTEATLPGAFPLGGERRLAYVQEEASDAWPECPPDLRAALTEIEKKPEGQRCCVRMVLATPALFDGGWRPGWLDESLTGTPPIPDGPRLKLVAAAVPRRIPVSGWFTSRDEKNPKPIGPKPVRWAVPAGAVYIFEVLVPGLNRATLADAYLAHSVCDRDQDRRDGYGLAVWGVVKK
jgi:CRISPR-associated protein Cmr3